VAVGAVVGGEGLDRHDQLGQQDLVVAVLVHDLADPPGQLAGLGLVVGVPEVLAQVGPVTLAEVGVDRVVAQLVVLDQQREHVDPEPVHPRSSQNRSVSSMAVWTSGLRQLRSGWASRKKR
jgi:hypothetical protein